MSIKKITTLSMFTVIALTIFVVESYIPVPIPIPGIKLGLSNIITLLVLYNFSFPSALFVLLCRILLQTMFTGQAMSLIYSLCGGILCLCIMFLCKCLLNGHFIFLVSIFGAIFHNIGQLLAASLFTGTFGVFAYMPYLLLSGIVTGLFTGLCAYFTQNKILPHMKFLKTL